MLWSRSRSKLVDSDRKRSCCWQMQMERAPLATAVDVDRKSSTGRCRSCSVESKVDVDRESYCCQDGRRGQRELLLLGWQTWIERVTVARMVDVDRESYCCQDGRRGQRELLLLGWYIDLDIKNSCSYEGKCVQKQAVFRIRIP